MGVDNNVRQQIMLCGSSKLLDQPRLRPQLREAHPATLTHTEVGPHDLSGESLDEQCADTRAHGRESLAAGHNGRGRLGEDARQCGD